MKCAKLANVMVDPTAKMQGDLRIPDHVDLLGNPNPVVKWLEEQAKEIQQRCATLHTFDVLC